MTIPNDRQMGSTEALGERNGPTNLSDRVRSLRLPERGGKRSLFPWVLCAVFALSTVALAFQVFKRPADSNQGDKKPTLNEKTADSGEVVLEAKGYIIPAHQIMISPLVSGQILELNFEEGQKVKKGFPLARIDARDYTAELDRSEAALAAARSRLKRAEEMEKIVWVKEIARAQAEVDSAVATQHLRHQELERAKELLARKALSEQEYDVAVANKDAADKQVTSLRQALEVMKTTPRLQDRLTAEHEVQQAEAEVHKAELRVGYCVVTAPQDGTILTKKAEVYNIVNPIAFNVSASLCEMADLSDLEVDLSIQERDISNVKQGQKCAIMPEAWQNNKEFRDKHPNGYDGKVSRLMPIADRAKGAIPVRVKVQIPADEQGDFLKPDMGVIVSFKKFDGEPKKKDRGEGAK